MMKVYYNGIFGQQDIKLVRDIINIVTLDEMFSLIGYSISAHAHRNLFQIFAGGSPAKDGRNI
ncbi:hypothetical protein P0M11_07145 [Kaistella sp. PBT33-4]|nr:hypothetical protein [Kaistella sp. PBT33-4]